MGWRRREWVQRNRWVNQTLLYLFNFFGLFICYHIISFNFLVRYFIPPFRSIHDKIWTFERTLCTSLALEFTRKTHNRGIPLRTFSTNLNRFAENKAYCRENNGSCPVQGTLDLFSCNGIPIIATLPHFLDTHPSLMENIDSGLHPDRKAHEISVSIDLVRQWILSTYCRLRMFSFNKILFGVENWCSSDCIKTLAIQFRNSSNLWTWSNGKFTKHDIPICMDWRTYQIARLLCDITALHSNHVSN